MTLREYHYRWEFDLESSPEQLWPLVADTNRFNRDTGVPEVEAVAAKGTRMGNARRRLRLFFLGMAVEWEEQPFEWTRPQRFGVVRRYTKGPITQLRVLAELIPREISLPEGRTSTGTKLVYQVWAKPRGILGWIIIPIQIGIISGRNFAKTFREYDELAQQGQTVASMAPEVDFVPGGRARLLALSEKLVADGFETELVALLVDHVENADDFALARIRPYELAAQWQQPRRALLEACLAATRAGMLDLQWNLICPMCRGGPAMDSLREIASQVHCPACSIDFTVNFEQSVELTFRLNPSIRQVHGESFCIGGPQVTPHIVVQQLLAPRTNRVIELALEEGRYRLRTLGLPGGQHVRAAENGAGNVTLPANSTGWPSEESVIGKRALVKFENQTDDEQLFILERTVWSDDAATAAEVTALQMFRDLFSSEALRRGEQISVGTLTVLFTDLKDSTRMYREIGDATAFGRVMNHFDVLKQLIAEEDGALVKTIGDAVMAVFRQPVAAVRAMLRAQQQLGSPPDGMLPLTLKAGLHTGPCIAVTLNDRLDYFGSTVNLAARLEAQSTGGDVVISAAVYSDPGVRELLGDGEASLVATRFEMPLKGFAEEQFELWRIARASSAGV